ncbi:hypothetical protein R75483_07864 [Paraburkholderia domus]|nr:hypothetical protein R75483_07864 [Paraburkholderia domus]
MQRIAQAAVPRRIYRDSIRPAVPAASAGRYVAQSRRGHHGHDCLAGRVQGPVSGRAGRLYRAYPCGSGQAHAWAGKLPDATGEAVRGRRADRFPFRSGRGDGCDRGLPVGLPGPSLHQSGTAHGAGYRPDQFSLSVGYAQYAAHAVEQHVRDGGPRESGAHQDCDRTGEVTAEPWACRRS